MGKGKLTLSIEQDIIVAMKIICAARRESVSQHLEDYMTEYVTDNYDEYVEQIAKTGKKKIK